MLCVLSCWLCSCWLVFGLLVIIILFEDSFVIIIIIFLLFVDSLVAVDVANAFGAFNIGGTGDSIALPLHVQVLEALRQQVVLVLVDVIELGDVVPFGKEVDFL